MLLQSVEAVCRGIVQQAAAAAETAQKECAAWKSKYEAALDRCNQQEFKVGMTTYRICSDRPSVQASSHCLHYRHQSFDRHVMCCRYFDGCDTQHCMLFWPANMLFWLVNTSVLTLQLLVMMHMSTVQAEHISARTCLPHKVYAFPASCCLWLFCIPGNSFNTSLTMHGRFSSCMATGKFIQDRKG